MEDKEKVIEIIKSFERLHRLQEERIVLFQSMTECRIKSLEKQVRSLRGLLLIYVLVIAIILGIVYIFQ